MLDGWYTTMRWTEKEKKPYNIFTVKFCNIVSYKKIYIKKHFQTFQTQFETVKFNYFHAIPAEHRMKRRETEWVGTNCERTFRKGVERNEKKCCQFTKLERIIVCVGTVSYIVALMFAFVHAPAIKLNEFFTTISSPEEKMHFSIFKTNITI